MQALEMTALTFALFGFIFGLVSFRRMEKLEKKLQEKGVLDKDFSSY